jgi:predicted glycoside hydrolase/deacetylase ChbG (UPF0249 family)
MPDLSRRDFLKHQALCMAALGMGLPSMAAAPASPKKLRLILRADDLGLSAAANAAAFHAIEEGIITAANVTLNAPATLAALERLRAYPWLSIGWQNDRSGKPVLDPAKVPSLIGADGHFKASLRTHASNPAFPPEEIVYDHLVAQFRAQMLLSVRVLGRAPDAFSPGNPTTLPGQAAAQVAREFGLRTNTDATANQNTVQLAFPSGPGAPLFSSSGLRSWIQDNQAELINHRDALFGTQEFQNHLRFHASDLYFGATPASIG